MENQRDDGGGRGRNLEVNLGVPRERPGES